MASNLSMSYDDMTATSGRVKQMAEELRTLMTNMTADVNNLCDGWTAEASPIFREDYAKLANNVSETSNVVDELTATVDKYAEEMKALDHSYATSKINVG